MGEPENLQGSQGKAYKEEPNKITCPDVDIDKKCKHCQTKPKQLDALEVRKSQEKGEKSKGNAKRKVMGAEVKC